MRRPRLLVTGFGPFPSMPRNPSGALARRVASDTRLRRLGVDAECLVLTTAYRALDTELAPAFARGPDAVLMIGVAGRSTRIRIEERATSRRSVLFPDVEGALATRPVRAGSRPAALRASIAPAIVLRLMREQGLPARVSRDAGRYLCNAAYHRALASGGRALFIHIPKRLESAGPRLRSGRRSHPDWRLADALVAAALLMLRHRRRPDR